MCIILDANCFGDYLNPLNEDLKPIRKWLTNRGGKIAYSDTDKFRSEWNSRKMDFRELNRAGRLKLIPKEQVLNKQEELKGKLESNDAHVVALAIVAGIRLLVVQRQSDEPLKGGSRRALGGDTDLQRDFKKWARGKVYVTSRHKHLLKNDLCP